MDLKEFIKETISAIVTASAEIAEEHESAGVLVSPPLTGSERDVFDANSTAPPYRRVNIVEFDVAVTASQETGGGGKAGLKIFSVEAGVDGSHASRNEAVSRVKFSVPIALGAGQAELETRQRSEIEAQRMFSEADTEYDPFSR